ncbi:MAG: hypothetical protein KA713_02950 [Chryseotalea sp. WA131a]|nr:MAG: hypothetical protein KA713_02950 [Chryseotalea sp. WA131a]
MRSIVVSVLVFLVIVGLDGCFTAPNYPVVPEISFVKIGYEKPSDDLPAIVLDITFKDGDGDLGLDDSFQTDTSFVLQYYLTRQNQFISDFTLKRFPSVTLVDADYVKNNPNVRLPNGSPFPSLNCSNWEQRKVADVVKDIVYTEYNPNYYNIFIDLFIDDGTGTFNRFNSETFFTFPDCLLSGFNGRFPVLSTDPGKKAPLDGNLNYRMKSIGYDVILGVKRFKMDITIQDRAYHKSNKLSIGPYTLSSIRRDG